MYGILVRSLAIQRLDRRPSPNLSDNPIAYVKDKWRRLRVFVLLVKAEFLMWQLARITGDSPKEVAERLYCRWLHDKRLKREEKVDG